MATLKINSNHDRTDIVGLTSSKDRNDSIKASKVFSRTALNLNTTSSDTTLTFRPFTKDSFKRLLERESRYKLNLDKRASRAHEAHLVNGKLIFGADSEEDIRPKANRDLREGKSLQKEHGDFPEDYYGIPLEEIDEGMFGMKTFVVIGRRFRSDNIFRFTATRTFFILPPWNIVRRAAIYIVTNQIFDFAIMLTILINCVFLTIPEEITYSVVSEFVFLAIYLFEMIVKILALGFFGSSYTYLRDPWNWLDFIVILIALITVIPDATSYSSDTGSLQPLRAFRVLRALKTVSIIFGLKTIVGAILKAFKMLLEVILLTCFCLIVIALFALQIFKGTLLNKCVKNIEGYNVSSSQTYDQYYADWTNNADNWQQDSTKKWYQLCGNESGAGKCDASYTCLGNIGNNPNYGNTGFDNLGMSMLTSFQLLTLDFWEDIYNKVIASSGPWSIFFFLLTIFFGSFYLLNLMLAVVAMSYEQEVKKKDQGGTRITRHKKKKKSPGFYELARIGMLQKQMAEMSTKIAAEKARQSIINEENLMERPRKVKFPLEDVAVDPDKVSAEQDSQGLRQPAEKAKVVQKQTTLKLNINANDSDGFNSVSSPAEAMQQRKVTLHQGSLKMEDRVKGTGSLEQPKKAESAVASSLAGLKEKYHQNQTNNKTDNNNINPTSAHESVKNINTSTERMSDVSIELSADSSTSCDYFENSRGTLQDFLIEKVKGEQSSTHTMKKDATVLDITNDSQPSSDIKQKGELPKLRWKLATLATEQMKKEMPPAILPESSLKRRCRCISWFVGPWNKLRRILNIIVSDVLFDLFISFSIIVNTVFMATEHYGMHPVHEEILFYLNFVFAGIFIAEAVMKIIAKGKKYFSSGWNIFDLLIVLASITDLFLDSTKSLSVLRTLRLLRVIKLAKSWPTMRVLMTIIVSTLSALGYLTIILFLIIYIFAVLGLQLFREDYKGYDFDGTEAERWHFEDFYHSFMMIFRVLCGEWVEPLHQCLRVSDKLCFAVFFPTLIIGNFIVLNLFLALLINAFATENINKHKQSHKDSDKLAQGVKRLVYIFSFVKNMNKGKQKNISTLNVEEDVEENGLSVRI